ncbi:hypothetical protein ABID97_003497 [Variovorax sp. OAS795]
MNAAPALSTEAAGAFDKERVHGLEMPAGPSIFA